MKGGGDDSYPRPREAGESRRSTLGFEKAGEKSADFTACGDFVPKSVGLEENVGEGYVNESGPLYNKECQLGKIVRNNLVGLADPSRSIRPTEVSGPINIDPNQGNKVFPLNEPITKSTSISCFCESEGNLRRYSSVHSLNLGVGYFSSRLKESEIEGKGSRRLSRWRESKKHRRRMALHTTKLFEAFIRATAPTGESGQVGGKSKK